MDPTCVLLRTVSPPTIICDRLREAELVAIFDPTFVVPSLGPNYKLPEEEPP